MNWGSCTVALTLAPTASMAWARSSILNWAAFLETSTPADLAREASWAPAAGLAAPTAATAVGATFWANDFISATAPDTSTAGAAPPLPAAGGATRAATSGALVCR